MTLAEEIKALWVRTKPSETAQQIRVQLSTEIDELQIPEEIWDLVDIAVQRGLDKNAGAVLVSPNLTVDHACVWLQDQAGFLHITHQGLAEANPFMSHTGHMKLALERLAKRLRETAQAEGGLYGTSIQATKYDR